jgi:hypothetical protein
MLPKIIRPEYKLTLPSDGRTLTFSPFLVKQEKLLLMAQSSGDPSEIVLAIKNLIKDCIVDDINIDKLPAFDVEYLFIKIRAKSVNNIIHLSYKDSEDEEAYPFDINLDELEVSRFPEHSNRIKITDEISMIMKYPTLSMDIKGAESEVQMYFEIVRECIDKIYNKDEVYNASDVSKEELDEFVQMLPVPAFQAVQDFFDTSPKLVKELEYTNKKGTKRTIKLETLTDFFSLS